METFSALLAICVWNSPVHGEFPPQRPVTWSFDVFFDLRLSKQSWGWWFEMLSRPLWRHWTTINNNQWSLNHVYTVEPTYNTVCYNVMVHRVTTSYEWIVMILSLSWCIFIISVLIILEESLFDDNRSGMPWEKEFIGWLHVAIVFHHHRYFLTIYLSP